MALISTGDIRTWMGIEEGDKKPNPKFEAIIPAVQGFCDSYLNRRLEAETYFQDQRFSYLDGNNERTIFLPQYPVSYVSSVHVDTDRVFDDSTKIAEADFYFYPSGKLITEGSHFVQARRNVLVHYTAGYAPIVGGSHNSAVSTYPIPADLKQVMVEMCVDSIKEGMTALHSVVGDKAPPTSMIDKNGFWRETLLKYRAYSGNMGGIDQ